MQKEHKSLTSLDNLTAAIVSLDKAMVAAVQTSERAMGIDHTGRQNRTLHLFAKLIAHCMSIMKIATLGLPEPEGVGLLDHSSVAALGRVVVDCSVMIMYISEPSLNRDEWSLRLNVLYLHELVNRKRFLSSMKAVNGWNQFPFFNAYEANKTEIQNEITKLVGILGREDDLQDFLSGQKVFLDGARGAAREAGWNIRDYEFYQAYLSNWVHTYPVSFMRADEQELSFSNPSPFQLAFCATVLEMASAVVGSVTERIKMFTGSKTRDPLS